MASIINGFQPIEWFRGLWGGSRTPAVVQTPPPVPEPGETRQPEQTGPQAAAGTYGFGWCEEIRGTPSGYRQMLRVPSLALVSGSFAAAILAGSWSVEAEDDAPPKAKEAIERAFLRHRTPLLRHGLRGVHMGKAGFEVVKGIYQGLTLPEYFKPLREDGLQVWTYPDGSFAGLRTSTDKTNANGPTITGDECFLWTYDGEPGDFYGRSRLENVRETAAKWVEIQNRIGALAKKEAGSVVKTTYPPADLAGADGRTTAQTNAQSMASGSGWIASPNALHALTKIQRERAEAKDIALLLSMDMWGAENLSLGGNAAAIAALQEYAAYLDVQIIRGYLQPERSLIEGSTGTKAEAGIHTDTGTTDCERVEADFVEALNCGPVDAALAENWGPDARGKVRIVAHPLRDVQESIDTMLIQNISTNGATADEFYRTYDMDAVVERRGIQKRKVPLPAPAPVQPPQAQPGANGHAKNGEPVDPNDKSLIRLAASRVLWGEE
jgi:hypothetical protein